MNFEDLVKLVDLLEERDALEEVRTFIEENPNMLNELIIERLRGLEAYVFIFILKYKRYKEEYEIWKERISELSGEEWESELELKWEGTLLHFSCIFCRPKVVSYLLSKNADVTKCFIEEAKFGAFDGLTAQQIAEKSYFNEIVALFKTSTAPKKTKKESVNQPQKKTFSEIKKSSSPSFETEPKLKLVKPLMVPTTLSLSPTPVPLLPEKVSEWTNENVVEWSSKFLKSDHVNVLRKEEITGSSLLKLTIDSLRNIGFPYGPASDFKDKIDELKQNITQSTIVSNTVTLNGDCMSNYRQTLSPNHSILKMASIVAGKKPQFDCVHSLQQLSSKFPLLMSKMDTIIEECNEWYEGWKYDDDLNPYGLNKDEVFSIVTYTHDLYNKGKKEENFYFQLNEFLRRRLQSEMEIWSGYLYYLLTALKKLPDVEITTYRGIPSSLMSNIQKEYKKNRPIHWSGFSSSSNDKDVAKQFAGANGIIFSIKIYTGKNIKWYSFLRNEEETLLSPNTKFIVTRSLYDGGDGYHYVELEEEQKVLVY